VGHLIPIEEPLVVEGEGQCSTQVEPSSLQVHHDPHDPSNANKRQNQFPPPSEQDQDQEQANDGDSTPIVDQGQAHDIEDAQGVEQSQDEGQGEDQNCRWISCRKNTGYHATDPKIRTKGLNV
jgi:hypothetical protein